MNLAIIIVNWNGKKDTLHCVRSLLAGSTKLSEIIVIDNGSCDGSTEELRREFSALKIIETGMNLGYTGGNNIGIREALKRNVEAVILLNNDAFVTPGCIDALIKSAGQDLTVGIWGSYPLQFSNPEYLDHLGGIWNKDRAEFDLIGLGARRGFETPVDLDYVCGCSMLIRREVLEKIGFLEEKFFLFWEEADFAMRTKRAGFGIKVCKDAILFHKVSASFVGGSAHKKYFWWRNRLLWISRNCCPEEKKRLLKQLIKPKLWHYKKLLWIKQVELIFLKFMNRNIPAEKESKIQQYRAVVQAIQDYSNGVFGPGPSWLQTNSID